MPVRQLVRFAPLLVMLLIAAYTDVRERRIRNWTTLPMILSALLLSFTPMRNVSPLGSFSGLLIGFVLTFGLFAIGALGGGDVKLMAGVGAWVGPGPVLAIFVVNAIIGMVVVLCQALWQGRLQALLRNSAVLTIALVHLQEVGIEHASATGKASRSVEQPLPYALTVLMAVLICLARS